MTGLAVAAFDEQEQQWLSALPPEQRTAVFYRLWNCKEAIYKLSSSSKNATNLACEDQNWNCGMIEHPALSICVCRASALDSIAIIEIPCARNR